MSREQFVVVYGEEATAQRVADAIAGATVFANLRGSGTHYPADESVVLIPRDSRSLLDQGREIRAIAGEGLRLRVATGGYEVWDLVERGLTAKPEPTRKVQVPEVLTQEQRNMREFDQRYGIHARR